MLQGPALLMAILLTWLSMFFLGYGLILWPIVEGFADSLRESGSSLLTLGFASEADITPTAIHFIAAATGLIAVALLIAYLPTVYASFNRREKLVTMLQSRAGSPTWGRRSSYATRSSDWPTTSRTSTRSGKSGRPT